MRSYAQYCLVAKATEILGDRWTVLIMREMLGGASGFNELQRGLGDLALGPHRPHARARAGRGHRAQDRPPGPHARVSPHGRRPRPPAGCAGDRGWGATWSFTEPRPEELDPDLLIVWMARHVDHQRLPPNRTVIQFDSRPEAALLDGPRALRGLGCLQHPGFDVDLEVAVDTTTLYRVYMGRAELGDAIRAGQLTMSGPRTLQRGSATGLPGAHSPQPAARRRSAAQPPHALPALIAYGSEDRHSAWPGLGERDVQREYLGVPAADRIAKRGDRLASRRRDHPGAWSSPRRGSSGPTSPRRACP